MDWGAIFRAPHRIAHAIAAAIGWVFRAAWYRAIVGYLRDLVHVLWISRVAAVSVILGLLVAALARQARDLFLEVPGHLGSSPAENLKSGLLFALSFSVAALIFWRSRGGGRGTVA